MKLPEIGVPPFLTRDMLDYGQSSQIAIVVDVWTSTTQAIKLTGFTKAGPFSFSFTPAGTLDREAFSFSMSELPIAISVSTESFGLQEFPTYAQAHLSINSTRAYLLAAGYVNSPGTVVWPQGEPRGPLEGTGTFVRRAGTDRAANTEITEDSPPLLIVKPVSFAFTLVTDANVANRRVSLVISGGGSEIMRIPAPAVQTASTTVRYIFGVGLPAQNDSTALVQTAPLPQLIGTDESLTLATVTTNLQVGDDFGAPVIYEEQFVMGPF